MQLQSGNQYGELRPTYAIWILDETLIGSDTDYVHAYKLRDEQGRTFIDHGGIWLLELEKFNAGRVENEEQRWLRFFKDGEQLDENTLPDWMGTSEMRQAMETSKQFSEKDRDYHEYQARQNFLRQQRSIQSELEAEREGRRQALAEKAKALADSAKAQAESAKAQAERNEFAEREHKAQAEIERLKALLEKKERGH